MIDNLFVILTLFLIYYFYNISFRLFSNILLFTTIVEGIYNSFNQLKKIPIFIIYNIFLFYLLIDNNPIIYYVSLFFPLSKFMRIFLFCGILSYITNNKKNKENHYIKIIYNYFYERPYILLFFIILLYCINLFVNEFNIRLFVNIIPKSHFINENEKFIICGIITNNKIMSNFGNNTKSLINYIGKDKVYVNFISNGEVKVEDFFKDFEKWLLKNKIPNKIETNKIVNEEKSNKFLLRNHILKYINAIPNLNYSNTRIIFIENAYFKYEEIIKLIGTNKGNYDLVCGLHLNKRLIYPDYYIGIDGKIFENKFPFTKDQIARNLILNKEYLRMYSCWSGVICMKSLPFKNKNLFFKNSTNKNKNEIVLFNSDLHLNGFHQIILNPNIIITYTGDWRKSYKKIFPYVFEPFFFLLDYYWPWQREKGEILFEDINLKNFSKLNK